MARASREARMVTRVATSLIIVTLGIMPCAAQQVTGVPGSPSATTTIDGKQLPPPPAKFGGVIKESYLIRSPTGRREWCRPRAHPTSC